MSNLDSPLAGHNTSLPAPQAPPHPCTLQESLTPSVDRVHVQVFMFAPVWNETPLHRMEYKLFAALWVLRLAVLGI